MTAVSDADLEATLPHLSPVVADMVRLQRLTGMRPGEVCLLRPCDVDQSGDVWWYRPRRHKTAHHGKERLIPIGPVGQDVLGPYLDGARDQPCFNPCDTVEWRQALRRGLCWQRAPSGDEAADRLTVSGRLAAGYRTGVYRQAIHRACDRGGVPRWNPNQLRQAKATELRASAGIEAAQLILGHASLRTTEGYADVSYEPAEAIARATG